MPYLACIFYGLSIRRQRYELGRYSFRISELLSSHQDFDMRLIVLVSLHLLMLVHGHVESNQQLQDNFLSLVTKFLLCAFEQR